MKTKLAGSLFLVFSTGFAMFAMFFGSGNLVFPISLGAEAGGHYTAAMVGMTLTGVVLPFVGLYAILLYEGNYENFFARMGKFVGFALPLFILALIGPFGVIPRTITVAHGNLVELWPHVSLVGFSILFCLVTFLLEMDKRRTVTILGVVLTPLLLISLSAIVIYGVINTSLPAPNPDVSALSVLKYGVLEGYYMMDLLAAFFFAAVVIAHVERSVEGHTSAHVHHQRVIFAAMVLGACLLLVIYAGLAYIAGGYQQELDPAHPERNLAVLATLTLNEHAGIVFVTAAVVACLTTAIALTIVSADFFQQRICKGKINRHWAVAVILTTSFIVSTFEFSGIFSFLAPILILIYPALIVLTLLNIAHRLWGLEMVKLPVYLTFIATVVWNYRSDILAFFS